MGSPEHKDTPSFAGRPKPRSDASICGRALARDRVLVETWLRMALRRGAVSGHWEGRFPRYVWYKDGTVVYEARLVNRELGEYKGYPFERKEWPVGLEKQYE